MTPTPAFARPKKNSCCTRKRPSPPPSPRGRGRKTARKITKEAIFHYCYAVLHDPVYREKYAQNLKREFPRIPFYADFWQWADWCAALMQLHIGFEAAEPFGLTRTDEASAYKLGNRSAIDWVLDQYKEKKPKDPTIREKFDSYRFSDYKDKVIDLLMRVNTVSVETVKVVEAMKVASR